MRRRNFIQSAGALTAFGCIGTQTVAASENRKKVGMAEVGIEDQVTDLLEVGEFDKAETLLDKHDVAYSITTASAGGGSDSGGGVSTQGNDYDKSDATGTLSIISTMGDEYFIQCFADFVDSSGDYGVWGRIDWVADAMAITYNNDHWASGDPTRSNVSIISDNFDVQYKKYNANVGLAAEATPKSDAPGGYASLATYLYLTEDNPNPDIGPKFTYRHTSAISPSGAIGSIDLSVGGMGVSLNAEAQEVWDYPLEATDNVP